ncbi:MAG: DUF2971 domain-containing protein [Elusimicrobiaceae bacterium]|jgi:hypothetical protein
MNLYKFSTLNNEIDVCRRCKTITTGEFYCQKFSEFNDIREGVFTYFPNSLDVEKIRGCKNDFRISSFTDSVDNRHMWSYYANGYKGIAIEIEVDNPKKNKHIDLSGEYSKGSSFIQKISYITPSKLKPVNWDTNNDNSVEKQVKSILLKKESLWRKEQEWRFLSNHGDNSQKIGKITAVYFGAPYGNITNAKSVIKNSKALSEYMQFKKKLIDACDLEEDFESTENCYDKYKLPANPDCKSS